MKETINYSQVPYNYALCLNRECNKADTCLRQLAEQSVPANIRECNFINPKYLATLKGACPHYRPVTKVRFAKGFIKILENLPNKQMQTVISRLITHFNRRTYYRLRKGDRLLSTSEQQNFWNILKTCGVVHTQEFDAYVEEYDW